ncbi:DUF433 domain-containing protein [Flexivirga sp.]|uniref:DUF433 domain-containing protein n=1 Tax=Flexivirga sp. TaxID=1962927 RepID=UPI003F7F593F
MPIDLAEPRFADPILTVREVASLVAMPVTTLQSWSGQRKSRPQVVTRLTNARRGWPTIPLVGLVESSVLRGLIGLGLPRREIRGVVDYLVSEYDSPHPFADQRLVTDGRLAYALQAVDGAVVTGHRVTTGQQVIVDAIKGHVRDINFADDHFAQSYTVRGLAGVTIDPRFNAGRMSFERTRTPLFAVADLLSAGETPREVANDFGLSAAEVEMVQANLAWLESAA